MKVKYREDLIEQDLLSPIRYADGKEDYLPEGWVKDDFEAVPCLKYTEGSDDEGYNERIKHVKTGTVIDIMSIDWEYN